MKKHIIISAAIAAFIGAMLAFVGVFLSLRPMQATGQASQVQLSHIFSASSTLPEGNNPATYCSAAKCPSALGTREQKISATSTGGTFITGATTTILRFDTSNTEAVAINLLHLATSSQATNTVNIAFEASLDGIDWYPHFFVRSDSVNAPPGSVIVGDVSTSITGSSSSMVAWKTDNVVRDAQIGVTARPYDKTRFIVPVVLARYLRLNVQLVNPGLATPSSASGTIRAEVIKLNPF